MIQAVLFDVGGPLDLETAFEAAIDAEIRAGLEREGFVVDEATGQAAQRGAIERFAPNLYRALIWQLTNGDRAACLRILERLETRGPRNHFELRPGIPEVLEALAGRDLKLGLVVNQPVSVLPKLERNGIGHYFAGAGISGVYGFRKPDVRLFLRVCDAMAVAPDACVMVGDRIDNDIAPAALLGMRTVLIRTGRHREQQPRAWDETPDFEAADAPGILWAIEQLIGAESELP